jgi:zinc protease
LKTNYRNILIKAVIGAMLLGAYSTLTFGQQETPPPPAAPRPLTLPKPEEQTLANGLRVIVIPRAEIPLVTAQLMIKSGAEVDPPQLAGLANMTASLLTRGTATRTAPEIAVAVEALGGTLDTAALWDNSVARVNVLASNIDPAMGILADVIRHPVFKDDEVERQRQELIDDLQVDFSEPATIARAVAARLLYGAAPYGHTLRGIPESLAQIKRSDIETLHSTYYRPDNAILVICGDIKPAEAFKVAERSFGDWQKPSTPLAAPPVENTKKNITASPRVVVVDKADAGQAAVVLVRSGLRRSDQDYFQGIVSNSVLTGYSGRLNQEIRIKRGLSYGAASILDVRREVGPFIAVTQTKNQSSAEVASLLAGELKRLSAEPVPGAELTPRKAALIGNFGRNLETNEGVVTAIGGLALYGLKLDEINRYIPNVEAITAGDIQKFASTRLGASDASIVIVGDGKQFLESLRKQFSNVEVIPASDLDLNSASLRRQKDVKPS